MLAALEEAYKNSIMTGKFPGCVLNVELPLGMVDVNGPSRQAGGEILR